LFKGGGAALPRPAPPRSLLAITHQITDANTGPNTLTQATSADCGDPHHHTHTLHVASLIQLTYEGMLVRSHIPPTRGTSEGRRKQHSRRQRTHNHPQPCSQTPLAPIHPYFSPSRIKCDHLPGRRPAFAIASSRLSALDLPGLSSSFAISESAKAFIHVRNLSEALHASTRATFTMQWVCTTTTCATYLNSCTGTFISLRWT
jgi:hypothetical protein